MQKTVLISGGLGGIGLTVAKKFKANGYEVLILDLDSPKREVVEKEEGFKCYPCNLTNVAEVKATVKEIVKEHPQIDALIEVAGLMRSKEALALTEDEWNLMFNINARGTFFLAQSVVEEAMQKTGGAIVNFSSAAAIRGFAGPMASAHYAASKAALIGLTRQLAVEWGHYKIRVNAVIPGGVLTEAMKKLEFDKAMLSRIPLESLSLPEDIANVVYFLASSEARMITGQAVVIDGGANIVGQ